MYRRRKTEQTFKSCPVCPVGTLVKIKGRYGEFEHCPKCGYIPKSKARDGKTSLEREADRILLNAGCGDLV